MRESNEASTSAEMINTLVRHRGEAVDLIAAVKGLHGLSPVQLKKLIKDCGNNMIRHIAEDGSTIQVDLEKFARYLPLHLISVIMAWERDKGTFKYLLCGILLLHSMCDLAARMPKIRQILLDDVGVSEQLIDLVIYLLVLLGEYRQENDKTRNDMVLLHSALVACSLKLLTVIVSPQYEEVAQVLIAYYKVDVFVDASVSAICTDVTFLQTKLSAEPTESSANASPTAEETLNHLCQQCDSSLLFLQSLCQRKLFRECVVKNKELCHNGGILLLVQAVMNLRILPSRMSLSYMASVARLKSRTLSILLHLCEAESVSYLDEVASSPGSQNLTKSIAIQVLDLLKNMFRGDSKLLDASSEVVYPRGQLELNAMRLTDVFSDDSNFRSFITINFTETLAAIFLLPHIDFLSCWCSSDIPLCEDDATLDVPRASYAHLRTSLLIKIIANLHCFVPDVCQDEKDLFLGKFVRFVQKETEEPSSSVGSQSTYKAEKTTVSKNIHMLFSLAESLVPRFLNQEDVQLLRLFMSQFEARTVSAAASEDRQMYQDTLILGTRSSSVHEAAAAAAPGQDSNDANIEEKNSENVGFLRGTGNDHRHHHHHQHHQSMDVETSSGRKIDDLAAGGEHASEEARIANFETSGSDSSTRNGGNNRRDNKRSSGGFEDSSSMMDDEKGVVDDEKGQQRKRKRAIMNDKQIALIEAALVEEPDMHRNSAVLRSWADKLSLHGAEVTTSRLKNWLNNRKARLARAAKGENTLPGGAGSLVDSTATAATKDFLLEAAVAASSSQQPQIIGGVGYATPPNTIHNKPFIIGKSSTSSTADQQYLKLEQSVLLLQDNEVIGKGKVFQTQGNWCGRSGLECSGLCVVDVVHLRLPKSAKLPHPPADGETTTFDETEKKLGLMRVLWDTAKLLAVEP